MWRSVSFTKVAGHQYLIKITFFKSWSLRFVIRRLVSNRKAHHIKQILIALSAENVM